MAGVIRQEEIEDFVPKKNIVPNKLKPWIEARKKYRLSHVQVQMARELGLNPKKFGGLANHEQQQWKAPLPDFIEHLYEKHFGKPEPDDVRSIEEKEREKRAKKETKRKLKALERHGAIENDNFN